MNRWIVLALTASSMGCATNLEKHVETRTQLTRSFRSAPTLTSHETFRVKLENGLPLSRVTKGSRWKPMGLVAEGVAYKATDTVFVAGRGNTYEAFLVVDEGIVIGVYVPTEDALFSAAENTPFPNGAAP